MTEETDDQIVGYRLSHMGPGYEVGAWRINKAMVAGWHENETALDKHQHRLEDL